MRWVTMVLLGVWVVGAAGGVPKGNTVTLAGDVWVPYVTEDEAHPGYLVEAAQAALALQGLPVKVQLVPWSRALEMTNRGQADGVIGVFYHQARNRGLTVPDEPMALSANHLFVRPGFPWRYTGPESLSRVTLGTIADYDYGELNAYIDRAQRFATGRVQVQAGNGALALNLQKLVTGRLDVVVDDVQVVAAQARALGLGPLVDAGAVSAPQGLGVAFGGDSHGLWLAQRLSEGLRQLRASGELARIAGRYGL